MGFSNSAGELCKQPRLSHGKVFSLSALMIKAHYSFVHLHAVSRLCARASASRGLVAPFLRKVASTHLISGLVTHCDPLVLLLSEAEDKVSSRLLHSYVIFWEETRFQAPALRSTFGDDDDLFTPNAGGCHD